MKVLIADDDRISRTILAETVREMGHEVTVAVDGKQALELLESKAEKIQLAILDWTMPHLDGPEVCARVRRAQTQNYVYLILVSARTKPESILQGLEAGADDYVAKPFSRVEIHARVRAAQRVLDYQAEVATYRAYLDEIIANLDCGVMLTHPSGRVLFANEALSRLAGLPTAHAVGQFRDEVLAIHSAHANDPNAFLQQMVNAQGAEVKTQLELEIPDLRVIEWTSKSVHMSKAPGRLDLLRDVTAEVAMSRKLEEQAMRDHLTGLLNRRGGDEAIARETARASRNGKPLSFLLIDIDHFKHVNDEHGHAVGDVVLAGVAKIIAKQIRPYDHCVRWGGEEILVVLPETSSFHGIRVAERIRAAVESLAIDGAPQVTISIGVTELGRSTVEKALEAVDQALYGAKDAGRNCVRRVGEELPTLPPPMAMQAYSNPPP